MDLNHVIHTQREPWRSLSEEETEKVPRKTQKSSFSPLERPLQALLWIAPTTLVRMPLLGRGD
ncbi:Hypothetical predicted protein [Podarcis lilfordi]|uniref:Uncharacterized protein n=1 Tax=Podarcis lilfordi TaxID=74358 RepID=A0AA35KMT0_9SAUR|nr:Hypothetical predicted protein [Podarcis lilfordi]